MQTMDMIVIKKKRVAIAKRQSLEKSQDSYKRRLGLWGMLTSVGSNRGVESKCSYKKLNSRYLRY